MSLSQLTRIERLEAGRTDVTSQLVVRRYGEDMVLFSRTIRYQEPAAIELRWPERERAVESIKDHNEPEVEGDVVQHRSSNDAI